jgi:hypothetical protein
MLSSPTQLGRLAGCRIHGRADPRVIVGALCLSAYRFGARRCVNVYSLGVQRPQDDCRRLAGVRRWKAGELYVDNDVSAYKRRVRRPALQPLLEGLEAGAVGGMVVYDLDRQARQPRDLERLLDGELLSKGPTVCQQLLEATGDVEDNRTVRC